MKNKEVQWHDVFIVAGLVGLVIAVAWALIYKNPPQEVLGFQCFPERSNRKVTGDIAVRYAGNHTPVI